MSRGTRKTAAMGLVLAAVALRGMAGCGSSESSTSPNGANGDASDASTAGSLGGGSGSGGGSSGSGVTGDIDVEPANASLTVTGPGTTLDYQAFVKGSSSPSSASWFLDDPSFGTIDSNGLFTASALTGGVVHVTAQVGSDVGTTSLTVHLQIKENPGGVDPGTQSGLENGGTADAAFRFLYPYDHTVFPRGLTGPVLQFDGTAPDALLVRAKSALLDYEGFYKPSAASQLALPDVLWTAITTSAQAGDPVTIQVTKSAGGAVTGPITQSWTIAQGSLKGTVYYNSYTSPAANGVGAVMRIKPGADASVFLGGQAGGCTVCHTVSANGSVLTAAHGTSEVLGDYNSGTTYDLGNGGAPLHQEGDSAFTFGALTPDGALLLSNGALPRSSPSPLDWTPNVPGQTQGPRASHLYDPKTGATVPAAGLDGAITYALMPSFAPDGKEVAFNHYDTGSGHSLAVMQFDQGTRTFSQLVDAVSDPSSFLGWPSFTPDGASVVYETDDRQDYATWQGATGDLSIVDLASKTTAPLDALNGIANGTPYLPYGASEAHLNYEPTILPVAVGGFYWVVFTSLREYGNTITDAIGAQDVFTRRRKLWVAAIDVPPKAPSVAPLAAHDVSHPAFYLPGQELAAGNMRGFWALDPCKAQGATCASGAECCGGFCRPGAGGASVCVAPPSGCSNEYEACTTDADCCGAGQGTQCINGHCAQPPPK